MLHLSKNVIAHKDITGLIVGCFVTNIISYNQDIDYNELIDKIDNFLCQYTDDKGNLSANQEMFNDLVTFVTSELNLPKKINLNDICNNTISLINMQNMSF